MQELKRIRAGTDITLGDVFSLVHQNLKLILLGGIIGLLGGGLYLATTSEKFAARGQLRLAQLVSPSAGEQNISFMNVEEPLALIYRLRSPATYSDVVIEQCNLENAEESGEYLGGLLKVTPIKNVPNEVDFVVLHSSPELAKKCALAIVEMLMVQQREMINDRYAGYTERIAQYAEIAKEEKRQFDKVKSEEMGSFTYLSKLDRLGWLRIRMDQLEAELFLSQKHPLKLVTSIYTSNRPSSPKVRHSLLFGAVLGILLGLLYVFGREWWISKAD